MAEQATTHSWRAPKDHPAETPEVLYFRYHGYRRRQATRLLHIMPREAVRDLYARARDWARERGLHDGQDPMATLVRFAEHLLPLPPFEVWLADREQYPLCHIEDSSDSPHAATIGPPGRLDDRRFDYAGRSWTVSLHVFRDGAVWRGFLRFRELGLKRRYHTANIFLEETAREVQRRFREFDRATLGAFLRSVLP